MAAGSLVLKDVPPRTMVAGSPAKEVGKVMGKSSRLQYETYVSYEASCPLATAQCILLTGVGSGLVLAQTMLTGLPARHHEISGKSVSSAL